MLEYPSLSDIHHEKGFPRREKPKLCIMNPIGWQLVEPNSSEETSGRNGLPFAFIYNKEPKETGKKKIMPRRETKMKKRVRL